MTGYRFQVRRTELFNIVNCFGAVRLCWLSFVCWSCLLIVGCRSSLDNHINQSNRAQHIEPSAGVSPVSRNPLQDNEYTMADLGLSNGLPIVELFPMLIAQERVAIAERNMNKLAALWIADGSIIDQRGTKKTEDDYIWSGRQAILDRYKLSVFRYSPPLIEPPADLAYGCLSGGYQDSNNSACLVLEPNEGDKINAHRNNGDAWQFVYMENRWWFEQLTYNP